MINPFFGFRVLAFILCFAFVVNLCNYILYVNEYPYPYRKEKLENLFSESPELSERKDPRVTEGPKLPFTTSTVKTSSASHTTPETNPYDEVEDRLHKQKFCPKLPKKMGVMPALNDTIRNAEEDYQYALLHRGGHFVPLCKAHQTVAVILPFRKGNKHRVNEYVSYMHSFLMKQQIEYQIFVVENSVKTAPFNHAFLFNIGFIEAQSSRAGGWSCIVLQEPHLLPLDARNLYRCGWYPRQLLMRFNTSLLIPYDHNFGGAIAISPEQFKEINGFPNTFVKHQNAVYAGFLKRIVNANWAVESTPKHYGYYANLEDNVVNPTSTQRTTHSMLSLSTNNADGISNITYQVHKELYPLYYLLSVSTDVSVQTRDEENNIEATLFTFHK